MRKKYIRITIVTVQLNESVKQISLTRNLSDPNPNNI